MLYAQFTANTTIEKHTRLLVNVKVDLLMVSKIKVCLLNYIQAGQNKKRLNSRPAEAVILTLLIEIVG